MSITGHCYCQAVRFSIKGEVRPVAYCHCSQCRRLSGHFVAASACTDQQLSINGSPTWFESSPGFERAFCQHCGSPLFWRKQGSGMVSVMAGAFSEGTALIEREHICVDNKAAYYQLCDALPKYAGAPNINQRDAQNQTQ